MFPNDQEVGFELGLLNRFAFVWIVTFNYGRTTLLSALDNEGLNLFLGIYYLLYSDDFL